MKGSKKTSDSSKSVPKTHSHVKAQPSTKPPEANLPRLSHMKDEEQGSKEGVCVCVCVCVWGGGGGVCVGVCVDSMLI